ncbi:MAG TPA: DinB family protein [Terriglobia bacterium]|nr:DinB family protein [Terriglobia bacterium]
MQTDQLVIARPESTEYLPYYGQYISKVPGADILKTLKEQVDDSLALLMSTAEEKGDYRYGPGKWSVREVVGHIIDTERIMGYRALRISRNDATPIEGFEQDDYIRHGPFQNARLRDLAQEFGCVRHSTLYLFQRLDQDAWLRRGVANKAEVSVRALAYIIAGHELHHRKILKELYFKLPD